MLTYTLSVTIYPDDWAMIREEVLERDGGKCRICGDGGEPLSIHHIDRRRDCPTERDNLVSVCNACHPKLERLPVNEQRSRLGLAPIDPTEIKYPQTTINKAVSCLLQNRNSENNPSRSCFRGDLKEHLIQDPSIPIQVTEGGGERETVYLTSVESAVEYLKDNGGDVPFGY